MCACARVRVCVRAFVRSCVHTCVLAYRHVAYVYDFARAYV